MKAKMKAKDKHMSILLLLCITGQIPDEGFQGFVPLPP